MSVRLVSTTIARADELDLPHAPLLAAPISPASVFRGSRAPARIARVHTIHVPHSLGASSPSYPLVVSREGVRPFRLLEPALPVELLLPVGREGSELRLSVRS